jgi:hypothetical protein
MRGRLYFGESAFALSIHRHFYLQREGDTVKRAPVVKEKTIR